METAIFIIIFIFALFYGAFYFLTAEKRDDYNEELSALCNYLNFVHTNSGVAGGPAIQGSIEGFDITIDLQDDDYRGYLGITLKNNRKPKFSFKISKETEDTLANKKLGITDIEVGDFPFDNDILIHSSDPVHVFALLNKPNRDTIKVISDKSFLMSITGMEVSIRTVLKFLDDFDTLFIFIKRIISLFKDFNRDCNAKDRIIENIRKESDSEIILKFLHYLATHFPVDSETEEVLRELQKSKDSVVQFEASMNLGEKGLEHLSLMAGKRNLPVPVKKGLSQVLGQYKYVKAITPLIKLYNNENDKDVKMEILKTFEKMEDPSLNGFLMKNLNLKDEDLLFRAVKALGTCGTADAVEDLYLLGKGKAEPFIKHEISKTIRKIHGRYGEAGKGWLSLAEVLEEEGRLSFSEDEESGKLSFINDEERA